MAVGKSGLAARRWRAAGFSLVFGLLSGFFSAAAAPKRILDVHDPFEVMAEVRRLESQPLWPGFDPAAIPLGLFDGERTYLVDFPAVPEGFAPVRGRPGVQVHQGRHPSIFGNTCVRIDGIWIASSIPVRRSDLTGHDITLTAAAAVILHEKFHVFQAVRHPDWKPNDGVLLSYPLDKPESLDLRSRELEAMRRAVLSLAPGDIAWARTAANLRRERCAELDEALVRYERDIRRLEGLAEYTEYKAAGKEAAEGPLPLGFAPKAIREQGYASGRWIAVLLDRFVPGWQEQVEAGTAAYPEDILDEFLRRQAGEAEFSASETADWKALVRASLAEKDAASKRILEAMNRKDGLSVVIDALRQPLRFESFEPFTIEAVAPRVLLHRQGLSLKNNNGEVHLFGAPALTETDTHGRVIRILIPGLSRRIRFRPGQRAVRFRTETLAIELKSVLIRSQGYDRFIVELR